MLFSEENITILYQKHFEKMETDVLLIYCIETYHPLLEQLILFTDLIEGKQLTNYREECQKRKL